MERDSKDANRKWVDRAIERGAVAMDLSGDITVDLAQLAYEPTCDLGLPFRPMIRIGGKMAKVLVRSLPSASLDVAYMWKDALKRQVAYHVDRATVGRLRLLCLYLPRESAKPMLLEFALRIDGMNAEITFCTEDPLPAKWKPIARRNSAKSGE